MSVKRDYYEILGIDRNADKKEIRRAYRRLAREHHPDVSKADDAEDRFKEITEAYEILNDEERRAAYDRFGHAAFSAGGAGAGGGDPFGGMGGQSPFGDIFETFFGGGFGGQRRQRQVKRGADVQVTLDLEFREAVFGVTKEVEVNRYEPCGACNGTRMESGKQPQQCPQCNGSGEARRVQNTILGQVVTATTCDRCRGEGVLVTDPCSECRGRGRIAKQVSLEVKVPAGVDESATLRLSGQGEQLNDGVNGNLMVQLRIKEHEVLKRRDKTILYDLPLNISQAVLGTEVEVPTVDGSVELTIPAGTQARQQFRLRARGVPDMRGTGRGDQIVTVHVIIPTDLTGEQRRLFEQLDGELGEAEMPRDKSFFSRVKDALGV